MALYVGNSVSSVPALIHVGFGARIRCWRSGGYLGITDEGKCVVVSDAEAPLWYLVSRDKLGGSNSSMPRCALSIVNSPEVVPKYLSLYDDMPEVSENPAAVRLVLPTNSNTSAQAVFFSFRQVLQRKEFLSVSEQDRTSGKIALRPECGSSERFTLEVYAPSIGRGYTSPEPQKTAFVSVTQALTLAILELGVRFRLRSVHGRVLHLSSSLTADDWSRGDPICVLQGGPRTNEDETRDIDLVFDVVRRSSGDEMERSYMFREVHHDRYLSVDSTNNKVSRNSCTQDSAALLVTVPRDRLTSHEANCFLHVQPVRSTWSAVCIGGVSNTCDKRTQWLMAGPRGRLEARNHLGAWESFRLEYVQQTFIAALTELPISVLYADADSADRVNMRSEIAAQVVTARSQSISNGGFSYAAAIGGIGSDSSGRSISSKSGPNGVKSSSATAGLSQSSSKGNARTTAIASSAAKDATASLPRNRASKKSGKKNKKKGRKSKDVATNGSRAETEKSGSATSLMATNQASTSSASSEASSSEEKSQDKGVDKQTATAAATSSGSSPNGPLCAACGRSVVGTYTKALGNTFHSHCFCCRACRRPISLGASQFREHKGAPYCNGCYASSIAPKCARCSKPIVETVTTAMEKTWHKECLTCVICRLPLTETFWLYADKPKEPRCSRCVTGSENRLPGVHYGSGARKAVNLPGPLFQPKMQNPVAPSGGAAGSGGKGRARLSTPVLPLGK